MIRLFTVFALFFMGTVAAFAQSGELSGKVTDDKGEGVPFATVKVEKDGQLVTGGQTDFDGFYTVKPLAAGTYDVTISVVGYTTTITKGVRVGSDKITTLDKKLTVESQLIKTVEIVEYKVPLIDKDEPASKTTITQEDIKNLPTRNIQSIASTSAGVYQQDEGKGVSIRGAREGGTEYYIDGIRVTGSSNIPSQSIEQLTVITGGIPAKYGDATGGVINITTRGPSNKFNGGVSGITSQGMDAQGYNDVNFNLTGPIYTKHKGTDSAEAKIGFFLAGEYLHELDPSPSAVGVYQVNSDILKSLQENPLIPSPTSKAFLFASDTITKASLYKVKSNPNVKKNTYTGAAKIDFKVTDNIQVTVGANIDYSRYNDYVDRYVLFNSVNNPIKKELSWRAFARFTQRFGKQGGDGKEASKSAFQNAYYSLQFDYSKVYNTYEATSHGTSAFDYGYLGKYDIQYSPTYALGKDDVSGKNGYIYQGESSSLVTFTASDKNPNTTNFVKKYFELAGNDTADYYTNLDQIQLNNGLLNGSRSALVYSLWYNTGRLYNGYGVDHNDDQFRVSLNGSVDIQRPGGVSRNKHSLEFGIEFEQRIQRGYTMSPLGLWDVMRQEVNRQISELDKSNPILLIDGVKYAYNDSSAPAFGVNDTVLYNYAYNASAQTNFDKNLRASLGLRQDGTEKINVDALDPSAFNLDMFSAEELLNNGSSLVSYYGYDYKGNKLSKTPSFNDFFTQKDDKGNYTRAIAPFQPIYTAGYIQDKFNFKDLLFNVGVRIDRYDANQKVLKDPYSLYKILNVEEAKSTLLTSHPEIVVPTNIGNDYAVYVNDITNPTEIVGYRKGNVWYNKEGVEVNDPKVFLPGSATPYLDKNLDNHIKSSGFDPNQSFENYTPQINVMPRVSFSFNVTDEALFFAHYDILTQRPTESRSRLNPTDYFYLDENVGSAINNPNLKPEKTIDYEVGFKQKVASFAAVTFSAFYREIRDNIQLRNIAYAYPKDYLTFDNIDFGTVKGFTFNFDMRRNKETNLGLKLNYSIQFAEGTGSSDISQQGILSSGQPNLRTVAPLDYDARHTFNISLDYRYDEGKDYTGPKIKGKNILENFGINLLLRGRSGTPYTAQSNPTPDGEYLVASRPILSGSKNGSRLPWTFRVDLRVDKSFNLQGKKKAENKDARSYYLNVYLQIENLLNLQNVLTVYHYTGNANDDGYLTSALGQQEVRSQLYPQSFTDLYNIWINNPSNYSLPRSIRLGLEFSF